jgi:hypothetical protein
MAEPSFTEEEDGDHTHEITEAVIPDHITCDTITASTAVYADEEIHTPELYVGVQLLKELNGALHTAALDTVLLEASIVDAGALKIAGTQFFPNDYATHLEVTEELVDTLVNH